MHTCTNCAHEAALGAEALNVCTNCGVVAAETASLGTALVFAAAAVGAAYLAVKLAKSVLEARAPQTA
jgi:hypothetical protein